MPPPPPPTPPGEVGPKLSDPSVVDTLGALAAYASPEPLPGAFFHLVRSLVEGRCAYVTQLHTQNKRRKKGTFCFPRRGKWQPCSRNTNVPCSLS